MCLDGEAKEAVRHIRMTADNYEEAKNILKDSFYRPLQCQISLTSRINELSCNINSLQSQLSMTREAKSLVQEMQAIDKEDKMRSTRTTIIHKYSETVQEHIYEKMNATREKELPILKSLKVIEDYLVNKITIRSSVVRPDSSRNPSPSHNDGVSYSNVQHSTPRPQNSYPRKDCVYCGKHNNSTSCREVTDIDERWNIIKANHICGRCLGAHSFERCNKTCPICSAKHHISVCRVHNQSPANGTPLTGGNREPLGQPANPTAQNANPGRTQNPGRQATTSRTQNSQTIAHVETVEIPTQSVHMGTCSTQPDSGSHTTQPKMWTGNVLAMNPLNNTLSTNTDYMMDSGATCSFITPNLAKTLGLTPTHKREYQIDVMGGMSIKTTKYDVAPLTLCSGEYKSTFDVVIFSTNDLMGVMTNTAIPECDMKYISDNKIQLSDTADRTNPVNAQILISSQDMTNMLTDRGVIRRLPSGLTMIPTYLGNVIGGSMHSPRGPTNLEKHSEETVNQQTSETQPQQIDQGKQPSNSPSESHNAEIKRTGQIIEKKGDSLFIGFIQATSGTESDEDSADIGRQVVIDPFSRDGDDSPIMWFAPSSRPRPKKRKKESGPSPLYRVQVNEEISLILNSKKKLKDWQLRNLIEDEEKRVRAKEANRSHSISVGTITLNGVSPEPTHSTHREIIDIPLETITTRYNKLERCMAWEERMHQNDRNRKANEPVTSISSTEESRTTTSNGLTDTIIYPFEPP